MRCRASSTEVLPAPLSPISRFSAGPGDSDARSNRRRPAISSRITCMRAPQSRTPGQGRAFGSVPRGTEESQAERHHHVAALLAARLADEGGRVRVAELEDDVLVTQGGEGIEQVVHVEADRQAIDSGIGLDLFLRLFLLGVMCVDAQLARRDFDAHAAVLL